MGAAEVRKRLLDYMVGTASLRDLDEFVTRQAWDTATDAAARTLANAIALRLDEYSSSDCDEEQLKSALRPMVTNYELAWSFMAEPVLVTTASSSVFTQAPDLPSPKFFERSRVVVPA
jgi:hypothetical protein